MPTVIDQMRACEATTIDESSLLFRRCDHGIFHPVGHLRRHLGDGDWSRRHYEDGTPTPFIRSVVCDGCCDEWAHHAPKPVDR